MYLLQPIIPLAVVIVILMEVYPVILKDTPPKHPKGNSPGNHGNHGNHNNNGNHGNRPGHFPGQGSSKSARRRGNKGSFNSILKANQKLTGKDKLFQGDVMITEELRKAIKNGGTDYIVLPGRSRVVSRAVSSDDFHKWPLVNGAAEIPYRIEDSSDGESSLIKEAIVHWTESVPCLRFVPRTSQEHFISFFKGQGCYSYVGRVGGNQRISIGENCRTLGIVAHEIGHALGFWHEQSRPDRDEYVNILWDNIQYGREDEFKKILNGGTDDLDVGYDYNSLMHYGPTVFAKKQGLNTIVKKNGGTDFGSATELSPRDIEQARRLYCPGTPACLSLYEDKEDKYRCYYWMLHGYCKTYKDYMHANCEKTCICKQRRP